MMSLLLRPLRMAVVFDQEVSAGGGYQQSINAALLIKKLPQDLVTPIFFTTMPHNVIALKAHGIEARHLALSRAMRVFMRLRRLLHATSFYRFIRAFQKQTPLERQLSDHSVDIVYLLSPSSLGLHLERLNYITTVWDLCHRDEPEFPEVRNDFQFESRESLYRDLLPKSTAVLVDSPIGQANISRRYGVDKERVHVMPFSPALGAAVPASDVQVNIQERYSLDCRYVYYPAQFWAHKNHSYLLQGLRRLEDIYGYSVGAVFSGGDKGNLSHVRQQAEELGLSSRIRFAGFVPDNEVPSLYRQALALVMPTYFGPTNLPPLEAFSLGVPVLYPDREGLRDQVGDAALLMDLRDPDSMAQQLARLIQESGLREKLIVAGRIRLASFSDEARLVTWTDILQSFRQRRVCWDA